MKIAIIGYGKMGQKIAQLAKSQGHEVVLTINIDNTSDLTVENLQKADVAIEFSTPSTAFDNIKTCLKSGTPVVSGTTAWLDKLDEAKNIANQNNTGLFYASNFSIGVNITFAINKYLAKVMNRFPQYDVTLHEVHHTQKLDSPSGTAITLAEGILENMERKDSWTHDEAKSAKELTVTAQRFNPSPGTHTILYHNLIDQIELKHTAHSRDGFAQGAIDAAAYMIGKKGFHNMENLLAL